MTNTVLNRRQATAAMLQARGDALVVASLGNPTYDVAAAGDSPANFYLWGAMGGAAMMGLGLALAQPKRRVVVFVGDGEMLMGLGSLATIACEKTANLTIVALDNEHYAETGMQRSHTGRGIDLAALAKAAGFATVASARTAGELASVQRLPYEAPGPVFIHLKVSAQPEAASLPARDGPYLRSRFREHLLGAAAHA